MYHTTNDSEKYKKNNGDRRSHEENTKTAEYKETHNYCEAEDLVTCDRTRKGKFSGKLPSTEYDRTVN